MIVNRKKHLENGEKVGVIFMDLSTTFDTINDSFNQSIIQSINQSIIVPIRKKGDKQLVKNYRPVSWPPICGKVFERKVFERSI